ncbi:Hsp70 family protein [Clostridium perfringens]|uniref:Chaperone protein DnaK n=1 Tax=Clostridium perfringens TaxID=1502 RepID=A0AAW9I4R8_CLOPF|nr:Hsp70 family protein [Clostridium perfringens]MBI5982751.1 Hsp70 family protein [Clostridium perfringens]MBI5999344.1 Hsp70 family protein [Clostridium perfringens]MBI6108312.1 Hsp70 family protein [Clostridium perfringens]MDB2060241.1 Hsp70 family protein [Clostridium perfringens]MDB2062103.1 Hsp70 family protein [Clostridium perfringens]
MEIYCGIDLGTTNSTVSIIEVESTDIIDNLNDKIRTLPIYQFDKNFQLIKDKISLPSALYFDLDENNVYTGEYAKCIYGDGSRPMQTIKSVKTRIGGESLVEIPGINNKEKKQYFNMVQCSAILLKTIKNSLDKQCGKNITKAVVTVPAAFNNDQRQATHNAMRLAGFKEIHILDEPTAALLYYINKDDLNVTGIGEENEYRLVYDIGGGTLDVSIAKMCENEDADIDLKIVARSPIRELGGNDFDKYLAAYYLAEFEKSDGDIRSKSTEEQNKMIGRLVFNAEKDKIVFNSKIRKALGDERKLARTKYFASFELNDNRYINSKLTKEIVEKVLWDLAVKDDADILIPVKQSLRQANIEKDDITEVILTGGMSNFFIVEDAIRRYFGENVDIKYVDTETAVSKGAAIYHYHISGEEEGTKIKLEDMMADDIFIKNDSEYKMLIPRNALKNNTEQMIKGKFDYVIDEEECSEIAIFLYYGLGDNPLGYTPLIGRYIDLHEPKNKGDIIEIEWSLDNNKIIDLEIKELGESIKIKNSKEYDDEDIRLDIIQTLKVNGGEI